MAFHIFRCNNARRYSWFGRTVAFRLVSIFVLTLFILILHNVKLSEFERQPMLQRTTQPHTTTTHENLANEKDLTSYNSDWVHLCLIVCGHKDRFVHAITMLKSALILGHRPIFVHVSAREKHRSHLEQTLSAWKSTVVWRPYDFKVHLITANSHKDFWEDGYHRFQCKRHTLVLSDVLQDVDSVVYVDTDTLFFTPPERLWDIFAKFSPTQIAALAPDYGGYNGTKQPYYGPSDRIYELPCVWNFELWRCKHENTTDTCSCSEALRRHEGGVHLLHGSNGVFYLKSFKMIHEVFMNYSLGSDLQHNLLQPLEQALSEANFEDGCCKQLPATVVNQLYSYTL